MTNLIGSEKGRKKFIFYFPWFDDVHFTKDIGIIPFVMQKYYGYDVEIVTGVNKSEFPANEKYTENIKITFADSQEKIEQAIVRADILMLCGIYDFNISLISKFKDLNPEGRIYLKFDLNSYWMMDLDKKSDFIQTLKTCDIISVENRRLQNMMMTRWGLHSLFIPNGFYDFFKSSLINYDTKNNTILTVGRPGSRPKNSELLLNAFIKIHQEIPDWNLVMVGEVAPWFQNYYEQLIANNPELKKRITLTGSLSYEETKKRYDQAKIFCLTSTQEGSANVVPESLGRGCYVIITDVDSAIDAINYGEYGRLIPVNNEGYLQRALLKACLSKFLLKQVCKNAQIYARSDLDWITLCGQIVNHQGGGIGNE